MKKRYLVLSIIAVLILAVSLGLWQLQKGASDDPGEPVGGEIALSSTQGEFVLSDLTEDQLAVIYFGYTYCPDICPMSLSVMRQAMTRLGPEQASRIVPIMISVDPARDSLARLEEYLGFFGDEFLGLRGSEAQFDDVAKRYGVIWRKVSSASSDNNSSTSDEGSSVLDKNYTVDHTSSLFIVDREGNIRQRVLYSSVPQTLTATLEAELGQ